MGKFVTISFEHPGPTWKKHNNFNKELNIENAYHTHNFFSGKIFKNRTMIFGAQLVRKPVTKAVSGTPKFIVNPRPVYL